MFGNLFNKAKKVQNKNVMEAVVAGAMLTAAADGTIEHSETDKLTKLLQANDLLEAFRGRELAKERAVILDVCRTLRLDPKEYGLA